MSVNAGSFKEYLLKARDIFLDLTKTSFPYLFAFQCIHLINYTRKWTKKYRSFFKDLFACFFGSTVIPILFLNEKPRWLGNPSYFLVFFICWIIVVTLNWISLEILNNPLISIILQIFSSMSISNVLLNSLTKISGHYLENELLVLLLTSWIVGCGSFFFLLPPTKYTKQAYKYYFCTAFLTCLFYIIFSRPIHIIRLILRIPSIASYSSYNLKQKNSSLSLPFEELNIKNKIMYFIGNIVDWAFENEKDEMLTLLPMSEIRMIVPKVVSSCVLIIYITQEILTCILPDEEEDSEVGAKNTKKL